MLQIVVHPKLGVHLDKLALEHPMISAHINRKDKSEPRLIFSSNYAAFQNKGMSDTGTEHCDGPTRSISIATWAVLSTFNPIQEIDAE